MSAIFARSEHVFQDGGMVVSVPVSICMLLHGDLGFGWVFLPVAWCFPAENEFLLTR